MSSRKESFTRLVYPPAVLAGLAATALICAVFSTLPAAAGCGPSAHWVDNCTTEEQEEMENTGALVGIDLPFDGNLDCNVDLSLVLHPCAAPNNTLIVWHSASRDDSQKYPGLRPVDSHPDVMDTEIIKMCVTDGTYTLKAGEAFGLPETFGAVAEDPADSRWAESFFDIFFLVETPMGTLYNHDPIRVVARIDRIPPIAEYIHISGCFPLYTQPVGGDHIANLVTAIHTVNIPTLTEWGMIIMFVVMAGGIVWFVVRQRRRLATA